VAQIQLLVDQQDLVHGGFLFLSLSVVLQTSDYLGFLMFFLFLCLDFGTVILGYYILGLPLSC
jgi:hypothetical protein